MLKEEIQNKIHTVVRQYNMKNGWGGTPKTVYIPILNEIEAEFFSDDIEVQKKSIDRMKSLLLSFRAWEPLDMHLSDSFSEEFVDNYKNFNEWYDFLQGLIKDIEDYQEQRTQMFLC